MNEGRNVVTSPNWKANNWERANAETRMPQKKAPERKIMVVKANTQGLPRKGTPYTKIPTSTAIVVSARPTTKKASILPITISAARTGVESSCSMVPIFHSRAIVSEVSSAAMTIIMWAIPGAASERHALHQNSPQPRNGRIRQADHKKSEHLAHYQFRGAHGGGNRNGQ